MCPPEGGRRRGVIGVNLMLKRLSFALVSIAALVLFASLHPAARAADESVKTGNIKGAVNAIDGKPAANVDVKLFKVDSQGDHGRRGKGAAALDTSADTGKAKHAKPQAVQTTSTDDKGQFNFSDLPVGNYRIAAGGKTLGHGSARASVSANNTSNVMITLKQGHAKASGASK